MMFAIILQNLATCCHNPEQCDTKLRFHENVILLLTMMVFDTDSPLHYTSVHTVGKMESL